MKTERLKPGWKRDPKTREPVSPEDWRKRFVLRAITFPVASPVDREWKELRDVLRERWGETTALSNWILTELYARDVRREPGMGKLPKMPITYLYPEVPEHFHAVPSVVRANMENTLKKKYRAVRYDVLWTGAKSMPSYRYPAPLPIPNQSWKASFGKDNVPLVAMPLVGGEPRWTLRLRGGHRYRRQLVAFKQIVEGHAVQGELALFRKRANGSNHRPGTNGNDSGGQTVKYDVMCKLVAWFPRKQWAGSEGVMFATSSADAMVVALDAKQNRLWTIHGDHIPRWVSEHYRKLLAWSEDQKREQRPGASFQSRREAATVKFENRMDSAVKEFAAQIVGYARRRRFAELLWIEGQPRRVDEFRWFSLLARIETLCDEYGIEFSTVKETEEQEG